MVGMAGVEARPGEVALLLLERIGLHGVAPDVAALKTPTDRCGP
jgi:hypothetical protein